MLKKFRALDPQTQLVYTSLAVQAGFVGLAIVARIVIDKKFAQLAANLPTE